MFSDELEKISWEETTKAIYSKTCLLYTSDAADE